MFVDNTLIEMIQSKKMPLSRIKTHKILIAIWFFPLSLKDFTSWNSHVMTWIHLVPSFSLPQDDPMHRHRDPQLLLQCTWRHHCMAGSPWKILTENPTDCKMGLVSYGKSIVSVQLLTDKVDQQNYQTPGLLPSKRKSDALFFFLIRICRF